MTASSTQRHIFTMIVRTAVPIALTSQEADLLVDDLIGLASEMPLDDEASVFHVYDNRHRTGQPLRDSWRSTVDVIKDQARRSASLERVKTTYPSLTETER